MVTAMKQTTMDGNKRGGGGVMGRRVCYDGQKHRLKLNNNQPKTLFNQNADDIFMLISI